MYRYRILPALLVAATASFAPLQADETPEWVDFYKSKQYDKALKSIDQSMVKKVDEDKKGLYWSRSNINLALGNVDDAIEDCNNALKLAPNDPWTFHVRSMAYAAAHDEKNAVADATKAIELSKEHVYSYMNRAIIYKKLGNYSKAIEDYTTAIAKSPENGAAFYFRGDVLKETGKLKEADADFELAKKFGFKLGEDFLNADSTK